MNVIISALDVHLKEGEVVHSVLQVMGNGAVDEMLVIFSETDIRRYFKP